MFLSPSPPCIVRLVLGGLIFNINVMKDKWIDYITQLTLIVIILVLSYTISEVIELKNKVDEQNIVIEELQKRTLNNELRLEDITIPNDDLP